VYAAAVILDAARPIRGLNDSKQLTLEEREQLYPLIRERAVGFAVATASSQEIDRVNIYQASRLAMRRALEALHPRPDHLLVDALVLETTIPQDCLIHGDALSRSIAAASILAKVERDRSMAEWDRLYPGYGFMQHKGYATPEHLKALAQLGPTPDHRHSFAPVEQASGRGQLSLFGEAGVAWA
jgi:ribonuclease HII